MTNHEKALVAQVINEAASLIREWPMNHPLRPEALRLYKWLIDSRDNLCGDVESALVLENKRLRETLKEIATASGNGGPVYNSGEMYDMARDALGIDE
jgi:hypothetical protein